MASSTITVTFPQAALDLIERLTTQMDDITTRLARIDRRLAHIEQATGRISEEQTIHDLIEEQQMSDLSAVEADLEAKVTEMTSVEESAATMLSTLGAQVATLTQELANAGVDPALVAKFQALATTITDEDAKLAKAVAANTPAAPPAA